MKRLAIIGGVGAMAGVRLAHYLVAESQQRGATADSDFPEFCLYSIAMEGTDATGIVNRPQVEARLHEVLNHLSHLEFDYALMACNTLHVFHDVLRGSFSGVLLNMIQLACDRAELFGHKTVGVLCSDTTRKYELYDTQLGLRNMRAIYPTKNQQRDLGICIGSAIAGCEDQNAYAIAEEVIESMAKAGAQCVIVGCTELPLCIRPERFDALCIDAGKCAVDTALELVRAK